MNHHADHYDDTRLRVLLAVLADDEADAESRAIADHLERCEQCQTRLMALAGDESWWNDAQTYLSGGGEPDWKPDASWSSFIAPQHNDAGDAMCESALRLLGPPSHPELLGRLGRYDIERVIGHGGMGVVLKAHDGELNRPIAIKLLASHLAHVGAARERFAREGRAAAAVVHEHVVAIYNVETDGATPYLVMQYVPGRSLQSRVDEDGPLAIEETLRIGVQAAAGLAAAHAQGLVHRDVKPSNILLEESVERAVLTDFGLARAIDDASLTHTGILAGTPHYMSPEQATGGPLDHRSDLFSLGAVLYFMATGHPPFRADGALAVLHRICNDRHRPVWQWNKDVPDELTDLIDRLLEKKPGRRPASAAEVEQELGAILHRVQQYGLTRRRFNFRSRRLRRKTLWTAAVLLLAAITWWVTGGRIVKTGGPPDPRTTGEPPVATAESIRQLIMAENEFRADLQQAHEALHRLEQPTSFAAPSADDWFGDMESLNQGVRQLESRSP